MLVMRNLMMNKIMGKPYVDRYRFWVIKLEYYEHRYMVVTNSLVEYKEYRKFKHNMEQYAGASVMVVPLSSFRKYYESPPYQYVRGYWKNKEDKQIREGRI
jgi:hypothetical protein